MAAFLTMTSHRNPAIRGKAAHYILALILQHSSSLKGSKEISSLLPRLAKMLSDHTPEARYSTRHIIRSVLSLKLLTREELAQFLSTEEISKAFDKSLDTPWQSGPKVETSSATRAKNSIVQNSSASAVYKVPITISPINVNQNLVEVDGRSKLAPRKSEKEVTMGAIDGKAIITDLQKELSSNDWSSRIEALNKLTTAIFSLHETERSDSTSKLILSCFDLILERLEDGNVKVCLHALGCLQNVLSRVEIIHVSSPAAIIRSLLSSSSSSNK